ncbi:MAG: META domain-containing protein [Arenicellales bacterium]
MPAFFIFRISSGHLSLFISGFVVQIKISNAGFYLYVLFVLGLIMPFQLNASDTDSANSTAQASLTDTYWKLIELKGRAVMTAAGQREMKLTLRGENKATGFAGCNSFFGSYTFDESKISFSQLAASRKYCAETMDMESLFLKTLSEIAGYKIIGQTLQFSNDEGELQAKLQAVYLK